MLEVEMSKKCTLLWREARFQVKMLKAPTSDQFWRFRCGFVGQARGILHLATSEQNVKVLYQFQVQTPWHCTTPHYSHSYNYNCITPHSASLHYTQFHYTPLHCTTQTTTRSRKRTTTTSTTTLHCTMLHYTTLHFTTVYKLHIIALHCATLHYTTLNYTTLHSTTLH